MVNAFAVTVKATPVVVAAGVQPFEITQVYILPLNETPGFVNVKVAVVAFE